MRKTIEESISGLEERKKETAARTAFVNHSISGLQELVSNNAGLYQNYCNRIREVLDGPEDKRKTGLQSLVSASVTEDPAIKIALGGVNHPGLCSCVFVSAPRSKQHANNKMALIEDTLPLPPLLQLRSKSYLEALYTGRHLSVREIAGLTDLSHSVVLAAMGRFGIPQNGNGHKRPGQIPFGFEYADYQLVKSKTEQGVIRMIRQYRAGGLSLRQIAGQLNQRLVLTKNGGIWQANTVRKILARV